MALVRVGTNSAGLVIMVIEDIGKPDVSVPMRPLDAHSVASDLMNAAAIAAGLGKPHILTLGEDIHVAN